MVLTLGEFPQVTMQNAKYGDEIREQDYELYSKTLPPLERIKWKYSRTTSETFGPYYAPTTMTESFYKKVEPTPEELEAAKAEEAVAAAQAVRPEVVEAERMRQMSINKYDQALAKAEEYEDFHEKHRLRQQEEKKIKLQQILNAAIGKRISEYDYNDIVPEVEKKKWKRGSTTETSGPPWAPEIITNIYYEKQPPEYYEKKQPPTTNNRISAALNTNRGSWWSWRRTAKVAPAQTELAQAPKKRWGWWGGKKSRKNRRQKKRQTKKRK
jgi:hypothetical protein